VGFRNLGQLVVFGAPGGQVRGQIFGELVADRVGLSVSSPPRGSLIFSGTSLT
ncbi:unnamed protein product, partial [Gulo gulo]